ncbi:MAG: nitrate reductase associated protein [Chelatococcus sp.]|uniref:nitrate reductase associated protein n=1 Tax=Chelatococcus sp. TaxID=1953771 RepID=UPI0025C593BE|nr:nitrate reductase associated protein [Chelatococcus sp.]MBX3539815.1 nitrate reductase associated protein [Chelatococcus sp.]
MGRQLTGAQSRADLIQINSGRQSDLTIFQFETDSGGSMRCIPMAVRFKLDRCGVKLSLREWSRFSYDDRLLLSHKARQTREEARGHRTVLVELIETRVPEEAKDVAIAPAPIWADTTCMAEVVHNYAHTPGLAPPTQQQWASRTALQRFTSVRLTREGHGNENFVPAMREFCVLETEEASA